MITYDGSVWKQVLSEQVVEIKLQRARTRALVTVVRVYKNVSTEANAGVPALHLLVRKRSYRFHWLGERRSK